jgi:hypothetical protein
MPQATLTMRGQPKLPGVGSFPFRENPERREKRETQKEQGNVDHKSCSSLSLSSSGSTDHGPLRTNDHAERAGARDDRENTSVQACSLKQSVRFFHVHREASKCKHCNYVPFGAPFATSQRTSSPNRARRVAIQSPRNPEGLSHGIFQGLIVEASSQAQNHLSVLADRYTQRCGGVFDGPGDS